MNIKAVLFDFDDTLGDRERYTHMTYSQRIDTLLPDADPWVREMIIQQCLICDQHGDVPKEYIRDVVLSRTGVDLGDDFSEFWRREQCKNTVLYPDALDTLKQLRKRGYQTGIITNGDAESQRCKVESTIPSELIDVLIISGEAGIRKPEEGIFQIAAAKLGRKTEECAFVGDMFRNDVYGANQAGMMPIWIWPHSKERYAEVSVTRIHHIHDLLDIFSPLC